MIDLNKQLDEVRPKIQATLYEFNNAKKVLKEFPSDLIQIINKIFVSYVEIFEVIEESWKSAVYIIKEVIDNAPDVTKNVVTTLGQHGWYVSLDMPMSMPVKMTNSLLNGEVEAVDDIMCKFLELKLDFVEKFICDQYPKRANVIKSAFFAHKIQEYNLSIPVFLSQADGICFELIGCQLYSKATYKFVEQLAVDSFFASILEPLRVPMPISANLYERNQKEITFNRHQILHGEVVDYGTEINSYKAISLLNYICSILPRSKKIMD